MAFLSLACAIAAAASVLAPGGMFVAMGLAIFAVGGGLDAYRRDRAPRLRIAGAGATVLGGLALLLAVTRYGVSLAAISALERLL